MARYRSNQPSNDLFLLLFGLACLVGSIVAVAWHFRSAWSALAGPVPITAAELAKLDDPAKLQNPYVTIRLDKVEPTGLGLQSKSKAGAITDKSQYLLLPVEDRYLIVEVPTKHTGGEATGYLDRWSTPLRKEAIGKIEAKFLDRKAKMLPYQFDGEYSYRGQCWAMLGVAGFGLVIGLFLTGSWLVQMSRKPEPEREVPDDI